MDSRRRTTLLAIVLFAIVASLWAPFAYERFNYRIEGCPENYDFSAYYIAGKAFAMGLDPYENHMVLLEEANTFPGEKFDQQIYRRGGMDSDHGFSRYVYPPFALPLYALLTKLSYGAARSVWTIFYLVVYIGIAILLTVRLDPKFRFQAALLPAALTLLSRPFLMHILLGQIDICVWGFVALAFVLSEKGRRIESATALSVACLLKMNPVVMLAYFVLFRRDIKYLLWFASCSAILVAASLILVPVDLYTEFASKVLPTLMGGRTYFRNQSILRLVAMIQPTFLPRVATLTGFAAISGFAIWSGKRAADNKELRFGMFYLNVLVMLLFSAVAWDMVYVWTILPSAIVCSRWSREDFTLRSLLCVTAALMMCLPVYDYPILSSLNALGGLLMAALLAIHITQKALRPQASAHQGPSQEWRA